VSHSFPGRQRWSLEIELGGALPQPDHELTGAVETQILSNTRTQSASPALFACGVVKV
jgi:hypothetical protein